MGRLGGTVGDIEGLPFLEAIRQFRADVGKENVIYVHLTLVPFIGAAGELKTKPTQHSVKELTNVGIQPDTIVLRTERPVDKKLREKIALFCNVDENSVVTARDVDNIYDLPLVLNEEGLDSRVCEKLNIWTGAPRLEPWRKFAKVLKEPARGTVTIGMVGKYVELVESYKSLNEALVHGGVANDCRVEIEYIDAESLESGKAVQKLAEFDGILVPGGFGKRGGEGKVRSVKFARTEKIPFLGICLGLQMAVVEFARNLLGLPEANSGEFSPESPDKVIHLMEEQHGVTEKGATMRLGAYPCKIKSGSLAHKIYQKDQVDERHRHRWEVNNSYRERLEEHGMLLSGVSPDGNLVEMVEIPDHPWFVGVQFHPEFLSQPLNPHPLFKSFIEAALTQRDKKRSLSQKSKGVPKQVKKVKVNNSAKAQGPKKEEVLEELLS